eukprot:scaffold206484_cov19-Tisochrysis_lutea.AAC.1
MDSSFKFKNRLAASRFDRRSVTSEAQAALKGRSSYATLSSPSLSDRGSLPPQHLKSLTYQYHPCSPYRLMCFYIGYRVSFCFNLVALVGSSATKAFYCAVGITRSLLICTTASLLIYALHWQRCTQNNNSWLDESIKTH